MFGFTTPCSFFLSIIYRLNSNLDNRLKTYDINSEEIITVKLRNYEQNYLLMSNMYGGGNATTMPALYVITVGSTPSNTSTVTAVASSENSRLSFTWVDTLTLQIQAHPGTWSHISIFG